MQFSWGTDNNSPIIHVVAHPIISLWCALSGLVFSHFSTKSFRQISHRFQKLQTTEQEHVQTFVRSTFSSPWNVHLVSAKPYALEFYKDGTHFGNWRISARHNGISWNTHLQNKRMKRRIEHAAEDKELKAVLTPEIGKRLAKFEWIDGVTASLIFV